MTDQNRDANGRFLPGHENAGAGRKPRQAEEASFEQFRQFYSNGRVKELIEAGHRRALRGDPAMLKLILSYLWGQPRQEVDVNQDGILKIIVEYERTSDQTA